MVRRLGLQLDRHPTTGDFEMPLPAVEAVRGEVGRITALHQRSMKLASAARQLKVAVSTVSLLSRNGQLEVDPETDSSGARFVTRASVERCWMARNDAKRRAAQLDTAVPISEVARFTGHSTRELMDLVRAGVLDQVPGRRTCQLTATSLRAWMASREPYPRFDGAEARVRVLVSTADGSVVGGVRQPDRRTGSR